MPVKNETKKLNFLFTEKGFLLDEKDEREIWKIFHSSII